MPTFSKRSNERLNTCHDDLQRIMREVVKEFDCSILCGHRDEATQNRLLAEGKTQLSYPNSKHNSFPSMAVDVVPYPIDWRDRERFHYFAGYVMGVAERLRREGKIRSYLRWGGDWDRDTEVSDNNFDDLPHFEIYQQ